MIPTASIWTESPTQSSRGRSTIFAFRAPYWHDRLAKLRACGFNTVETYTCWNLHERREGEFDFSGNLDLAAYLDEAAAVGLQVILRPGPYICAEWEFGGLPSWLLTYPHLPLRCYDERFLRLVERYYTALFAHIKGRLACDGGNVIMVQVENEYGSYGDDHRYMRAVADIYARCGVNVPLFTSDGPPNGCFGVVHWTVRWRLPTTAAARHRPSIFSTPRAPISPKCAGNSGTAGSTTGMKRTTNAETAMTLSSCAPCLSGAEASIFICSMAVQILVFSTAPTMPRPTSPLLPATIITRRSAKRGT